MIAPFLGIIGAGLLVHIILRVVRKRSSTKVNKVFKCLQLVSASFVAFTHGTNDAQKTMGIIALALLIAYPQNSFEVPLWVIISSALAMAVGGEYSGVCFGNNHRGHYFFVTRHWSWESMAQVRARLFFFGRLRKSSEKIN